MTKRVQIIGGFPQSDWAQKDENAVDYIKNKPENLATQEFVQEQIDKIEIPEGSTANNSITCDPFGVVTEIIPKQDLVFEYNEYDENLQLVGGEFITDVLHFDDGSIYKVLWNGTEYTCTAITTATWYDSPEPGHYYIYYIGNAHLLKTGFEKGTNQTFNMPDTGEPFCLIGIKDVEGLSVSARGTEAATFNVHVLEISQIDNKYLAILDSEAGSKTNILPETTYNGFEFNSTFNAYTPGPVVPAEFILTEGETYNVIWDGNTYTCTAGAADYYGYTIIYIGNGTTMGQAGNDEPFAFTYSPAENGSQVFAINNTEVLHTTHIYQMAPLSYKLKEEYLPMEAIKSYIDNYIGEAFGGDY